MKPNLDKLENLSDPQLQKISADVEKNGIRKAAEQASKDTDRSIDKTCIQRLKERSIAKHFLVESPDAAQAAAEILRFAVTGRPDFSDATIKVLDETAFKLSLRCDQSEDEMKALNSISIMLARYRGTAVRERMAKIQEDKLQLRREEFEWKKSVHATKLETSSKSQIANQKSQIQEDHLGPLASTPEEILARARKKWRGDQAAATPHLAQRTSDEEHQTPLAGENPTDATPAPAPNPGSSRGHETQINVEASQDPTPALSEERNLDIEKMDIGHSAAPRRPYLQSENNSSLEITTVAAPATSPGRSRGHETQINVEASQDPTPALSEERNLDIEKTDIDHSAAPRRPYLQSEKNSTSTPVTNPDSDNPASEASSLTSLPSVSELAKAHAIKRWRAHIHRSKPIPEPDGSWRDECPCGKPLPCPDHNDLFLRVKCYRPQQPAFRDALIEHGVPYYIPTAAELACTQEELDKSLNPFAYDPQMKEAPDPRLDPFAKGPFNF